VQDKEKIIMINNEIIEIISKGKKKEAGKWIELKAEMKWKWNELLKYLGIYGKKSFLPKKRKMTR
jgi:hypothetical protein